MIGEKNYQLLRRIKKAFDPNNVFNKGKITDAFSMDQNLRYDIDRIEPEIKTIQDFSDNEGILKLAEKCNGSGDCRKPVSAGGTMCPSYRATKNEKDTTRARANALREFLTNSDKVNKFAYEELKDVFDLCLSCKACASECPSNVDVAALKAEFLYQYQKENKPSLRTHLFANNNKYNKLGSILPSITNLLLNNYITKKVLGIATQRSIPKLYKTTLKKWYQRIIDKKPARHNPIVIVVSNKTDLNPFCQHDMKSWIEKNQFDHIYTSVVNGEGINELFNQIATAIKVHQFDWDAPSLPTLIATDQLRTAPGCAC